MIHTMKLQPRYYNYIKNGTKRIEIRLYDEKRQKINLGDIVEFSLEPINKETFQTKVVGLLRYNSFEEMFKDFPIDMLADVSMSKEEFLHELEKYYPKEKQEQYSVIGIKISLLNRGES